MKTSHTKLRSKFLVVALLVSTSVWAKPVGQVTAVTGQAFLITPEGKTKSVKANDHLEDKTEIMVEEGGAVTINDFYDATYHLVGGGHLKFFDKSVQLKNGKTWVQAKNPRHHLELTTANGFVEYWKSEFIATFDQFNARSQLLVVNGEVEISNILDKNFKFSIPAGSFSVLDPKIENGIPRTPTKVGLASLNTALAEFKQLPADMKKAQDAPARGIASIVEEKVVKDSPSPKAGEIVFISTNRMPASVSGKAHDYFQKTLMKKKLSSTVSENVAPIRWYGVTFTESVVKPSVPKADVAPRIPASVPSKPKAPAPVSPKFGANDEFIQTLKKHESDQPKHSKEVENLINDLKSL
jgi:hypothetical protein